MADTMDLKSIDFGREGSNPSAPTMIFHDCEVSIIIEDQKSKVHAKTKNRYTGYEQGDRYTEPSKVYSVRMPESMYKQVRQYAERSRKPITRVITEAIECFLGSADSK